MHISRVTALSAIVAAACAVVARGQIVTFDTSGNSSAQSTAATMNATQQAAAVSGTPQLSRVTLTPGGGAAGCFFSVNANITNTLNLSTNYVGFTVTPTTGNFLLASAINWTSQGSSSAPNSYATAYSTDAFATSTLNTFTGETSTSMKSRNLTITRLITNEPLAVRFYNYGATSISGGTSGTGGSFRVITPSVQGSVPAMGSAVALGAHAQIVTSSTLTLGAVTGGFGVTKLKSGTAVMNGANTYNGTTVINEGALQVNSTHINAGSYTVATGGSLGGGGAVTLASAANVTVAGNLSPNSSAGSTGKLTLNTSGGDGIDTGVTELQAGGSYTWEINNPAGTGGAASGWDQVALQAVKVSATSGTKFTIKLMSLTASNVEGPLAGWDPNTPMQRFPIATFTGGGISQSQVNGIAKVFTVDTSQFVQQNPGTHNAWVLDVSTTTGQLDLIYVPEPGMTGLIVGAGAMLMRRRARRARRRATTRVMAL